MEENTVERLNSSHPRPSFASQAQFFLIPKIYSPLARCVLIYRSASTVFDVTRRHHFSERRTPLRQLPTERPFSLASDMRTRPKVAGFSRFVGHSFRNCKIRIKSLSNTFRYRLPKPRDV
jgi:hypothetical protein